MPKVKICGITNMQDATWCVSLGADYLGFNFYKESPRKVSVKLAADVLSKLPPICEAVGVFVDEEPEIIIKMFKKIPLKIVQLHGRETPEYCRSLRDALRPSGCKVMKAFKIAGEESLAETVLYADVLDYLLLDAYLPGLEGGTGVTFNWELAKRLRDGAVPFFLAGGLNPENVQEAVFQADPFAVDVASGVERLPTRKDYDKLKNFILNAKSLRGAGTSKKSKLHLT